MKLEKLIRCPRKWWAEVRKLGLIGVKKKDIYDGKGECVMRQEKDAVEVWRNYFRRC